VTYIEQYIIDKVKDMRKAKSLTQTELSQKMNMSDSFISHVESGSKRAKYNINHLNAIAKIFECSPKDFWPDESL
jgi:transcriptional regulator with XRE-family HTH domain